jgi:hypothetical protein
VSLLDKARFGRHGEHNGRSQLDVEQVRYIRQSVAMRDALRKEAAKMFAEARRKLNAANALANTRLARHLGVSEGAVRGVVYDQTWRHVR